VNGDEQNRLRAVLHEVNTLLMSDDPDNFDRERTLDKVKRLCRVAASIADETADDDTLASVPGMLHGGTRATFKLGVPDFPPAEDETDDGD
jgi:hypothetical protein